MKTAVISVKTDEITKKRAQYVAQRFGIPLSTLINAYLRELGETGQIHFTTVEIMAPKMEKIIEQTEKEITAGKLSDTFETADEAIAYLNSL